MAFYFNPQMVVYCQHLCVRCSFGGRTYSTYKEREGREEGLHFAAGATIQQ